MTSGRRIKPAISAAEALVVCAAMLAVMVGGPLFRIASGSTARATETWLLGGDFVEFYIAGRILNTGNGENLYDLELQKQFFTELLPGETSLRAPFLYPPFVALLFRPIAYVALPQALVVFMLVSVMLLIAGLRRLVLQFGPRGRIERTLVVMSGLSFFPFIGYTWLGAQISVIGFVAVAFAIAEEDRGRPFRAGVMLSACLYKPTLLVLVLPMLVITRRYRQIMGFVTGALALAILSIAVSGVRGSWAFAQKMIWMGSPSTLDSGLFNPYRYVDVASFFRLLSGKPSRLGWTALLLLLGVAVVLLGRGWLKAAGWGARQERIFVWSAALAWTPVLNFYVPFYDCVLLLVPAILVTVALGGHMAGTGLVPLLIALYAVPIFAEAIARVAHVQPYTLAIAAFGVWLTAGGPRLLARSGGKSGALELDYR